jgi:hypothetical protein
MAQKLVGGFAVTLLAVSFGAGYGWSCRGATECQPSSLLAIDTTPQTDVQLLQTIAGPNASYGTAVIGVNILPVPFPGITLDQRLAEADAKLSDMVDITKSYITSSGISPQVFSVGATVDTVTAGDGSSVVYAFIPVATFAQPYLLDMNAGQQAHHAAALVALYRAMGWSNGDPGSVTFGADNEAATDYAAQSTGQAIGDPHLQNIHGERFDLMQPGEHVLIHIPRQESIQNTLLHVQAVTQTIGGPCADTYFMRINVTGRWPSALRPGGFIFRADDPNSGAESKWMDLHGGLQVKVVHGRTQQGIRYLNFYIKHLDRAGFPVGGLLGEDDHEEASTPPRACEQRMALKSSTIAS